MLCNRRRNHIRLSLLFVSLICLPVFSQDTEPANDADEKGIIVELNGIQSENGIIRVGLFDSKKQFDSFDPRREPEKQGKVSRVIEVPAKNAKEGKLQLRIAKVEDGEYVVAAYHDEDSNGKLNSTRIGLPTEKYGFSRNARRRFGLPSYKSAKIKVGPKERLIEFKFK